MSVLEERAIYSVKPTAQAEPPLNGSVNIPAIRIGQGFDVHAFAPDRPLILGGVHIPHPLGLMGHSDADVLLHAVIDAILGAAALGDIGRFFPDHDARWKDADSRYLLQQAAARVREAGWCVVNIDATLICQQPRISPHAQAMAHNIAADIGVSPDQISIKGKTTEGLGFTGREEGIAAQAVALLSRPMPVV
jgi:2-C-methyl-D-erythritol 2,4-cyclodiphosphate synthase